MINIVWLKTFCTLAELGHFTQTAHTLFMTQSGVSQHIKKLEQHLDTSLLLREGKTFTLTEAGKKLYQQGKDLLRAHELLEAQVKEDSPFEGRVKIATPGSVGLKLNPFLLDLMQQHPKLVIEHAFAPNHAIQKGLQNHEFDLGLVTNAQSQLSIATTLVAEEPLVLVTHQSVESIDWLTLRSLGFIAHPDAAHHAGLLLSKNFAEFTHINQFEQKGFSNQISLILAPVSKGLGFTVLPLFAASAFEQQNDIKIHSLSHVESEPLYMCRHSAMADAKRHRFVAEAITKFLQNEVD